MFLLTKKKIKSLLESLILMANLIAYFSRLQLASKLKWKLRADVASSEFV